MKYRIVVFPLVFVATIFATELVAFSDDSVLEWTRWEKRSLAPEIASQVKERKSGNAIFRTRDIERARRAFRETQWGKAIAQRIIEVADYWASKSDQDLFDYVPTGNPRAFCPGYYYGDPIDGGNKFALYTSIETPYRWYNPKTGVWWYDGAVVENPETGERVTVQDDGRGFVSPEGFPHPGERTQFVAAYRLFLISALLDGVWMRRLVGSTEMIPGSTGKRYFGAIPNLAQAYALTGEGRYAKKAVILLGRLAELYPYMNGSEYGQLGNQNPGRDHVHWAEITGTEFILLRNFYEALDLVDGAVDREMRAVLMEIFSHVPGPDGNERTQPFDFDQAIDEMAAYAIQCCEDARIVGGNPRMKWIAAELCIAAKYNNEELMNRVLFEGPYCAKKALDQDYYRDGGPQDDSMGYSRGTTLYALMFLPLSTIGFSSEGMPPSAFDLFGSRQYRLTTRYPFLTETGALCPSFGDVWAGDRNPTPIPEERLSGNPFYISWQGQPGLPVVLEAATTYLPSVTDWLKEYLSGYTGVQLEKLRAEDGIFETLLYALPVEQIVSGAGGKSPLTSSLLPDTKISFLRCGNSRRTRSDLVLYGHETENHGHGDKLGIWFAARGRHLAANGGGYPFNWVSPKVHAWEWHSAPCWVVLIDGAKQSDSYSDLLAHYEGGLFQLSAMKNTNAYPGSDYQRTVWLVPGPVDGDAYVLDIFRVSKGNMFDYNTRGNDAGRFEDIAFDFGEKDLQWEVQAGGSLAGKDVPLYSAPGYGWMKDVRRVATDRDFSWIYDYGGASLRVHALSFGRRREVLFALGEVGGYEMGKSPWDPHVLWRDETPEADTHKTQFVTILESFGQQPFLQQVDALNCSDTVEGYHPFGLKINHANGYVDIVLAECGTGETVRFSDDKGKDWSTDATAAMQRLDPEGRVIGTEIFDGTFLKTPYGNYRCSEAYTGTVDSVDYQSGKIIITLNEYSEVDIGSINGLIGIFYPASGGTSAYRMNRLEISGSKLKFVSDISLIHTKNSQHRGRNAAAASRPLLEIDGQKVQVDIVPGDHFRLPTYARFPVGNN